MKKTTTPKIIQQTTIKSSSNLYSSILGNISNQTSALTKTNTQPFSKSLAKPQGHRSTFGGTTNKKPIIKNMESRSSGIASLSLTQQSITSKRLLKTKSFNTHTKQVSTASTFSPKSENETNNFLTKARNSTTQISKLIVKQRTKENAQVQVLDCDNEGDEFSLILEHFEEEKVIKCRKLPTSTLTQLKLFISPKPDLRSSLASRQSDSRRQSSWTQKTRPPSVYNPGQNPNTQVVKHIGTRYLNDPTSEYLQSSCDESSNFFDEHNKDEDNLHNCVSVNGYNLWPKILNQVTISLDPRKNQEMKSSIKLNDLVTKVPLTSQEQSTMNMQYSNSDVDLSTKKDTNQEENEDRYQVKEKDLHKQHLIHTLQSLQYIKSLTVPPMSKIEKKCINLPKPKSSSIKKTVIFDLDETLVHCVDDPDTNNPDVVLQVRFPNGQVADAGINVRPYAMDCLREASKYFQVVVFTASHKAYADVVLNYLDPNNEVIEYRLYRDSCVQTEEGVYIKDLRIIKNRNMKDMVIVDNAVYSFGFQLDSGIPILPFYDDKNDEELKHLSYYLKCLSQFDDIRDQNRKAFQLKELEGSNLNEFLDSFCNQNSSSEPTVSQEEEYQSKSSETSVIQRVSLRVSQNKERNTPPKRERMSTNNNATNGGVKRIYGLDTKNQRQSVANNRKLHEYFAVTKRGSLPTLSHFDFPPPSIVKAAQYYAMGTPKIKAVHINNEKVINSQSTYNNTRSKRRDVKSIEKFIDSVKSTPRSSTRQTPFFKQATPSSSQRTSGQKTSQQLNQLFKVPSQMFGGCTIKSNTQKGSAYLQKSTNYTVSTDDTSKKQTTALQDTPINKRQNNIRPQKGLDTPFNIGKGPEKRVARFSNPLAPLSNQRKYRTVDKIFLEDQKVARILEFKLVQDEQIFPEIYKDPQFTFCNMNFQSKQKVCFFDKLNFFQECDYETDIESIEKARHLLQKDFIDSMDFFITKDPLLLVNNI